MQVHPIKPTLKAPGSVRLKLKCDEPLSNFAFNCNLRRYSTGAAAAHAAASRPPAAAAAAAHDPMAAALALVWAAPSTKHARQLRVTQQAATLGDAVAGLRDELAGDAAAMLVSVAKAFERQRDTAQQVRQKP